MLLDQPRPYFIEMGFHFAQLLMYDQSLRSKSSKVQESQLPEMVRLSATILSLAMETADGRTQHLSDHIYHIIIFAAVTLCRLLHMYEHQLAPSHDIAELDQLVLTLASWLRSIGLPCHMAHTLGDVVSAFHEKLRPGVRAAAASEITEPWTEIDFALAFPDLLGMDLCDIGNGELLPNWEPFS